MEENKMLKMVPVIVEFPFFREHIFHLPCMGSSARLAACLTQLLPSSFERILRNKTLRAEPLKRNRVEGFASKHLRRAN